MPRIRVLPFRAIRCHLDDLEPRVLRCGDNADGAVIVFVKSIFEKRLYFLRCRARRDIPILRLTTDEKIAYTPADEVRLESRRLKGAGYVTHFLGDGELCFHIPHCSAL